MCPQQKKNKHFSSLRHKYILNYLFSFSRTHEVVFFNRSVGSFYIIGVLFQYFFRIFGNFHTVENLN